MSLQYDNSSYRLITLTESYISNFYVNLAIWSTMTGMEIKRLKNVNRFKELAVFNHFSFGPSSFLAHSNKSELLIIKQANNEHEIDG